MAGIALMLALLPGYATAAVNCATASVTADSDRDGFSDAAECAGITTMGTAPKRFPRCGIAGTDGVLPPRDQCVDPDSADVFIIYKPATTGSLLGALPDPFGRQDISCLRTDGTAWCGTLGLISFTGLSSLGATVHQLTPAQAGTDRRVATVSAQKAVRVSESLDVSSTDVVGNCQWGLPTGLDGCAVYTQRTMNFINSKCDQAGDTVTDRNQVFLAYSRFLVIHESGHSLGGLAAKYDAAYGGYHYPTTSGFVMSQSAQYDTLGGRCNWYIPSNWNNTLDAAGLKLIK